MSESGIFFGGDYIWVEIPADPTDLLITLPGDRGPSVISRRNADPYKNVWCEGNRSVNLASNLKVFKLYIFNFSNYRRLHIPATFCSVALHCLFAGT